MGYLYFKCRPLPYMVPKNNLFFFLCTQLLIHLQKYSFLLVITKTSYKYSIKYEFCKDSLSPLIGRSRSKGLRE